MGCSRGALGQDGNVSPDRAATTLSQSYHRAEGSKQCDDVTAGCNPVAAQSNNKQAELASAMPIQFILLTFVWDHPYPVVLTRYLLGCALRWLWHRGVQAPVHIVRHHRMMQLRPRRGGTRIRLRDGGLIM